LVKSYVLLDLSTSFELRPYIFGIWLDLEWLLRNQDWIWIVKYDSLVISAVNGEPN